LLIDQMIYQEIDDLKKSIIKDSSVKDLDLCCFTGKYVSGDISDEYLNWVEKEYFS